jgi:hypothetical protein
MGWPPRGAVGGHGGVQDEVQRVLPSAIPLPSNGQIRGLHGCRRQVHELLLADLGHPRPFIPLLVQLLRPFSYISSISSKASSRASGSLLSGSTARRLLPPNCLIQRRSLWAFRMETSQTLPSVRSDASRRTTSDQIIAEARCWDDFWITLRGLDSGSKRGAAFERLTQLYLQTAPEYRTQLRHVWLLNEVPENVAAHLNLPRVDEGIDIVAETRSGEFWAVQCKFRSATEQHLNRTDLATFTSLAFAHCQNIALAVVAHTSAKPVGKRKYMGRTVEIGLDHWLELDKDRWSLITARLQGRAERPSARLPRPHQERAINAARAYYVDQGAARGRLIMPCGTGKSCR